MTGISSILIKNVILDLWVWGGCALIGMKWSIEGSEREVFWNGMG
jgi:hypothetical protein